MNNRLLYMNSIREAKINFHKDFLVFDGRLRRVHVNPETPGDLRILLEALVKLWGVLLGDFANIVGFDFANRGDPKKLAIVSA